MFLYKLIVMTCITEIQNIEENKHAQQSDELMNVVSYQEHWL